MGSLWHLHHLYVNNVTRPSLDCQGWQSSQRAVLDIYNCSKFTTFPNFTRKCKEIKWFLHIGILKRKREIEARHIQVQGVHTEFKRFTVLSHINSNMIVKVSLCFHHCHWRIGVYGWHGIRLEKSLSENWLSCVWTHTKTATFSYSFIFMNLGQSCKLKDLDKSTAVVINAG